MFALTTPHTTITSTTNHKLKANFSEAPATKNNSNPWKHQPVQGQAILVEEREQTIMKELKEGKIKATVPNMERTLLEHELTSLTQKKVAVENTLPLN